MKRIAILTALVIAGLICVFCISGSLQRPYADETEVDSLETAVQDQDYILIQVSSSSASESSAFSYYEISGNSDFSALFDFENWSVSDAAPNGSPAVTLRFAETWLLELYPDGTALAHYGYAEAGQKADCYYVLSSNILGPIVAYIRERAIPHTLGDGTISSSTFHY